jgi:type II secretory pathway component GspD/PulD (secretin)
LGYLFRSKNNVNNNAELLIFVTPKIIRESSRL